MPARWRSYVEDTGTGAAVRRHYWELAVLYGLQAALRSGDVWVPGSRRWSDPAASLLPAERWGALREDFRQLTGMPAELEERLRQLEGELGTALEALEPALAAEAGPVRL